MLKKFRVQFTMPNFPNGGGVVFDIWAESSEAVSSYLEKKYPGAINVTMNSDESVIILPKK